MAAPLADRIRPQSLDEMVGQQHLLGPSGLLRRIAQSGTLPNLIFYGPSGVGKTTAARIIAAGAGKKLYRLNGTTASTGDIKALIADLGGFDAMGGVVLYLDEIQYLNKKQQQTLLEYIEDGSITLIASTTENPYFYVYNAILSRCTVFEFKPVDAAEVERYLESAMEKLRQQSPGLQVEEGALAHIAACCGGDVRKAANALEICALGAMATTGRPVITLEDAKQAAQRSMTGRAISTTIFSPPCKNPSAAPIPMPRCITWVACWRPGICFLLAAVCWSLQRRTSAWPIHRPLS